ncbi:hypothetical protein MNQ98_09330 [Paenibacillus sp. N3/727]|uniref:hypothetical protein n=1 Tax=Paenibacillus sp. N3/727 TaxID=2925845 RepID=UPI001F52E392|nr:hypothetical protein [Paenibacillus sp. N3/727]UNK20189.1 hypothetical protein MNQ98_09330 [Paenibacillus sp. N3/727]
MNSIFKKILTIFCLFILLFSASFQPKAKANPGLAIPAGIEIGAGAYVGVALVLAGTAGVLGYTEYSDEIHAHAQRV